MRKPLIALAIAAGLGLVLWAGSRGGQQVPQVDVAEVERGALNDTALASGNLVYETQIQLRSEVTGRVAEVLVEEGQRVQRGDLLMRLDQEAFQADLDAADAGVRAAEIEIRSRRARLADLSRQLERQRALRERGLVGQDGFEQLQSQHEIARIAVEAGEQTLAQAQAQRELSRDRLQRTLFTAPIDGVMISVDIKPGETVIAGTTNIVGSDLMVLADPSVLLAELRVDEADIARIRLGQPVQVFAAAHPNTPLTGTVVQIGTSARAQGVSQSLSFKVQVQIDPTELVLHPGMSCRAEIETAQGEPGLNVPVAAVRKEGEQHYVWRVGSEQVAERVDVEVGMANDFSQEVRGELKEGDRVVTGPGRVLASLTVGQPLRLREGAAEAAADGDADQ
ncbi:efflux RND transporter periplasmic adaptor subunit [Aquimonas voraii]|uniref:HlyD family secretion protein n=1 Tax=Aquimonas voraii TaxID=265719 RepID=A0A1G6XCN8_9GAMM|nr:efflux RND transporter periplasmic adaptor subunit [Aquimonas voraii]SDD75792.1 HlyD family secretion protein [Aquimonas voraii]